MNIVHRTLQGARALWLGQVPHPVNTFSLLPANAAQRAEPTPRPAALPLAAAWHVNPVNGRLECRWVPKGEATARERQGSALQEFGRILTIHRQGRSAM